MPLRRLSPGLNLTRWLALRTAVLLQVFVAGAASAQTQSACAGAFADSLASREIRALERVAAVEPRWDDYSLERHPLLLIADSSHRGRPETPVCAAIWKAGRPLETLELPARPGFSTPLYGMISLDSIGPGAIPNAGALASTMQEVHPGVGAALRARGIARLVVLAVPLDFARLGSLGEMLKRMKADPALIHADLAVHESFHLHAQFPAWLDQPRTYSWPAWDVQPDRRELRDRCYAGSPAVASALESELAALVAAFDAVRADSDAPDRAVGLQHARRFVELRAARRRLLDTVTVSQNERQISCAYAEDLMELEEGAVQWIGHATTVRAGLTTLARLRGSYAGAQPEAFYRTGPLQLWVLDALLGAETMRRISASIARSTAWGAPHGGVFAQFEQQTRLLDDASR
jgi:hypothetical protein